ncbi:ATP-dependent helicase HrpB [Microbacterium sp. MPKO10]|uniref:ATP-dependent helicase HrpB n=1 Tax=Microbacterium sp. MPKO10 TaxID=2989818 RepID=UPI0022361503|nr:ATP-dependent helicase HrpB [Microbacterium sp. MPKO10]MCW4457626.1 ATP-dependent helicase HrpB [Microbacterium sp. MPKO10]
MTSHSHHFDVDRIGAGLVVTQAARALTDACETGSVVVTAPPGTGKTTVVPPLVANLTRGTGRVIVTQPRRVAVRAAARRIAELDGSSLGGPVGFTVRGERRVSDSTRIEIVTPGVLLRRLLNDPGLDGVHAVILDEVHERSLDGDLLLGILSEVRTLRADLTLVAMSATLDAAAVADLMDARIVDVPSALHPLSVEYRPPRAPRLDTRGVTREFLDHLAGTTLDAQRTEGCDALVFVPTARDVEGLVQRLRSREQATAVEVLPLHGRLAPREQDRATAGRQHPTDPPRIVVSTSLAESSLTVPGVRLVVDAGLSREPRRDQARGMSGLVTVSCSRASADQRAGRAARQGPGRVVRAYSEADFAAFRPEADPEILAADLTDAALTLAAWGTPEGRGLPLLTSPPAESLRQAVATLSALELIDDDGRPTALGARIALVPLGAREARALLVATGRVVDENIAVSHVDPREAASVIAAISGDAREPGADLDALVRSLRRGEHRGTARWRAEAERLTRTVERMPASHGSDTPRPHTDLRNATGLIAALSRPDWIARRTAPDSRSYFLASGTRAALPEGSALTGSEWIAVCDVQRADGRAADGTGAVIRLAAALHDDDALRIGHVMDARQISVENGRPRARLERRVGAVLVSSTPVAPRPDEIAAALTSHLTAEGIGILPWSAEASSLRRRLALVHRELGAPWPDVTDAALVERLDDWLGPDLNAISPAAASLSDVDVASALRRLLPWPQARRLDELAPERLTVPSGSRVRIDYPEDAAGRPVVAVKLQEVFGLADTPRLIDGRVAVQFHLLSPARRPLAVTDDLASFWNGPYQDVRREMRGRYPKHPWPEDPWSAPATARTRRRAT